MYLKSAFAALVCTALLVSADKCDNRNAANTNTSGSRAAAVRDEFTREWAEVSRKYPLVAAEFLRHRAALAEGVRFTSARVGIAYQDELFGQLISNLPCFEVVDDAGNIMLRSVACEEQPRVTVGGGGCRSCAGACALEGAAERSGWDKRQSRRLVQECYTCMEGNASCLLIPR